MTLIIVSILLAANQAKSQSLVLYLKNTKNQNEHIVKPGDKVKLDIKNKKGKLKEKEEVQISSIDKEKLYIQPIKTRFPDQTINISELNYIGIKTIGTKSTGCLLFALNIFSKSSSSNTTVYKSIRFDGGKWEKQVIVQFN